MTGVTPNVRLTLPTYDQPGWDTAMNNNLIIIDSLLSRLSTLPGYLGVYVAGTSFTANQVVTDPLTSFLWQVNTTYTSSLINTFAQERAANPSSWTDVTAITNSAVISAAQAAVSAASAAASLASLLTQGSSFPTTLPATNNVLWNNGGYLCIS